MLDRKLSGLIIILTVVAIALAGLTLTAVTVNARSSGTIRGRTRTINTGPNVGVYSNSACTNAITSISWGSIEVGGSASQTIYIEDTGGAAMTLSISVSNWSPSTASTYITLTWSTLPSSIGTGVSNAVAVTLTLTASSSTPTSITSFSSLITISGTG